MQRTYTAALVLALLARPALAIDQTYFGAGSGPAGTCCAWVAAAVPAGQATCPADMLAEQPTCHVISDADYWQWQHYYLHDLPLQQRMKSK